MLGMGLPTVEPRGRFHRNVWEFHMHATNENRFETARICLIIINLNVYNQ